MTHWLSRHSEGFLPLQKGGGSEKVLAMLNESAKSFGVVFTQYLEVLTILKGGGVQSSTL